MATVNSRQVGLPSRVPRAWVSWLAEAWSCSRFKCVGVRVLVWFMWCVA